MSPSTNLIFLARLGLFVACLTALGSARSETPPPLKTQPAQYSAAATHAPILAATRAGRRIVAVGDHGVILLSDDGGKRFRQARAVPVSTPLTGVSFADERHGWAVGHWGVVLATTDGGEHWSIQRVATGEDRPLFSVLFVNAREGVAVGLWSLVLRTDDGGNTWRQVELPSPPEGGKADRNLFRLFAGKAGVLHVACERGTILRSEDRGRTWAYIDTGYAGSFWSGAALQDGTLLVVGLRGTVYRSTDGGVRWEPVASGTGSSLTDIVESGERLVAVGLDGSVTESTDRGETFVARHRSDRLSLTATVDDGGGIVLFSELGPVAAAQ